MNTLHTRTIIAIVVVKCYLYSIEPFYRGNKEANVELCCVDVDVLSFLLHARLLGAQEV